MESDERTNVLPFRDVAPRDVDPVVERIENLRVDVEAVHDAVSRVDARLRLDERIAEIEGELVALAGRIELIEHPDPDVGAAARAVHDGDRRAMDELAARLRRSDTWWERNRAWVVPVAVGVGAAVAMLAVSARARGRRRKLEAMLAREEAERREAEARVRDYEQKWVAHHAALVEARRVLAVEQARPLQTTYDHRSYPTHHHDAQTLHEHHRHIHRHRHTPERVVQQLVPVEVERVIRERPIVQPTVHTREVRTTTKAEVVPVAQVIERVIERQAVIQPTVHTREVRTVTERVRPRRRVAPRSRAVDEAIARLRETP